MNLFPPSSEYPTGPLRFFLSSRCSTDVIDASGK
jgi:hypothetical protein